MTVQLPVGYAAISLEFRHALDPQSWWTTFGVDSTEMASDLAELSAKAANSFYDAFVDQLSNDVVLLGCQVRLGDDSTSPPTYYGSDGREGTSTAEKLPQNCALLVRKQTALGGRKHRGRMFLPGILSEGEVDQVGAIASANWDSLQIDALNFLSALADPDPTGAIPMVILHTDEGVGTPLPTPVISLVVDRTIATQRRRLR